MSQLGPDGIHVVTCILLVITYNCVKPLDPFNGLTQYLFFALDLSAKVASELRDCSGLQHFHFSSAILPFDFELRMICCRLLPFGIILGVEFNSINVSISLINQVKLIVTRTTFNKSHVTLHKFVARVSFA